MKQDFGKKIESFISVGFTLQQLTTRYRKVSAMSYEYGDTSQRLVRICVCM